MSRLQPRRYNHPSHGDLTAELSEIRSRGGDLIGYACACGSGLVVKTCDHCHDVILVSPTASLQWRGSCSARCRVELARRRKLESGGLEPHGNGQR